MGTHANANFLLPAWDSGPDMHRRNAEGPPAGTGEGPCQLSGLTWCTAPELYNGVGWVNHLGKLPTALLAHGNKTKESQSLQGSCPISKITKCSWQTRVPAVLRHVQRKEVAL